MSIGVKIELLYNYKKGIIQKMSTIHVLTDKIKCGYNPIIKYFNDNKPAGCNPIRELMVYEGGFEIDLEPALLEVAKLEMIGNPMRDKNSLVRQVRWSGGKLLSFHHNAFTSEQTILLFHALQHCLGAENVVWC